MTTGFLLLFIIVLANDKRNKMKAKLLKAVCLTLLLTTVNFPQNQDQLIRLTPELGDTIDVDEMKAIGLLNLNNYKGFQSLVFYNRGDTILVTKITCKKNDGELKDTTIFSDLRLISNLRASLRQKELAYLNALDTRKPVNLITKNGDIYSGVIADVKDSGLVLLSRKSLIESDPEYNKVTKKYFDKTNLSTVFIEGKSNIGSDVLIGTFSGILIGALIGLADGDDTEGWFRFTAGEKALLGGLSFGGLGAIIGLISGVASSSSDKVVLITDDYDLNELKKYTTD